MEDNAEYDTWYVDIPDKDQYTTPDKSFFNVGTFQTRQEAIAFARENFGADDNGCICLIS